MKKFLSILLAAMMLFCLVGCEQVKQTINDAVNSIGDEIMSDIQAEFDDFTSEQTTAATTTQQTTTAATTENTTTAATTEPTTAATTTEAPVESEPAEEEPWLDPDGTYTTKDDVALYIHLYGCLPSNFISKKDAQALGWEGGSLEPYAPGMCIGGSYFGNYEGLLPEADGRKYTECDIDTLGAKSRGAKRIVFSNDGLIYYTDDHYESFTLLYGEE